MPDIHEVPNVYMLQLKFVKIMFRPYNILVNLVTALKPHKEGSVCYIFSMKVIKVIKVVSRENQFM